MMARELVLGDPVAGLRRPVLIAGFGGWGDAGNAASIAVRHLLGEDPPAATAMVDPSACYDFTVARPLTSKNARGQWSLEYPKIAFYPLPQPDLERDLLLLLGPEPHFRWPEIAPAIVSYARASGVDTLVTLGAFVGPVSHRTTPITARTLDDAMSQRLIALEVAGTDYEGPTAFATALLHAASARDIQGASLWVATPPYLHAGNPVAACALLASARQVLDLPLNSQKLDEVAKSFLDDVDKALDEHPELAEQLREMLAEAAEAEADDEDDGPLHRWKGPDPDRPPPDAPPGLPTGKSLVEAVERYLRQAREGDDD